ncbi:hypothetical protein ACFX16_019130 [Malus domestica]
MSQPPVQKPSQASVNQVHPNKLTGTQPELGKSPAQKRLRQKPGKKLARALHAAVWRVPDKLSDAGARVQALSVPPPSCDVATSLPLDFQQLVF